MTDEQNFLPFEVGQVAEARSFIVGFRSAWFRCKIKEISRRRGQIGYVLEYFDFPDEKINWTKLYQKPLVSRSKPKGIKKRQLMVRPSFPPVCHESELHDVCAVSEVTVIVNDEWKVGDFVDWWTDGCFWSGRVTQILGSGKVEIELPPPPVGEGLSYEVFCKDLRPSLEWSPEDGWKVPTATGSKNSCCGARLIQPVNQGLLPNSVPHAMDEGRRDVRDKAGSSVEVNASFSSHISTGLLPPLDGSERSLAKLMSMQPLNTTGSKEETNTQGATMDMDVVDTSIQKASCCDVLSSSHTRGTSDEMGGTKMGQNKCRDNELSKKMRTCRDVSLNSMCSDTLEASILDLEELSNRVKWLKGILEFGIPLTNEMRPRWEFIEHRGPSTRK